MKIREVLTPYYAPDTMNFATAAAKYKFEESFLAPNLMWTLQGLAKNHAGWDFFNSAWRRFAGIDAKDIYSHTHPDVILAFCESLGFTDVEPLIEWVEALKLPMEGKVKALNEGNSSDVVMPYETMPDITATEILELMRRDGNVAENVVIRQLDDDYKLLSREDLSAILRACPAKKMIYRASRRDCEDFSYQMKAWLGYLGYGNVTLGICDMTLWDAQGGCTGAHSVNWVVYKDSDGTIKTGLIEPQTNNLYALREAWLGNGINGPSVRNEIYWIEL